MPVGRPVKYKTPKEMQRIIDLYFIACKVHQTGDVDLLNGLSDEDLLIVNDVECTHPTVTGLALALDLTRQGLIEYSGKSKFSDTVKKAKARVEGYIEQRLYHNNAAGCIFNLKNNFGWRDKQDLEHFGPDGGPIEHFHTVELTSPEYDEESESSDTTQTDSCIY